MWPVCPSYNYGFGRSLIIVWRCHVCRLPLTVALTPEWRNATVHVLVEEFQWPGADGQYWLGNTIWTDRSYTHLEGWVLLSIVRVGSSPSWGLVPSHREAWLLLTLNNSFLSWRMAPSYLEEWLHSIFRDGSLPSWGIVYFHLEGWFLYILFVFVLVLFRKVFIASDPRQKKFTVSLKLLVTSSAWIIYFLNVCHISIPITFISLLQTIFLSWSVMVCGVISVFQEDPS